MKATHLGLAVEQVARDGRGGVPVRVVHQVAEQQLAHQQARLQGLAECRCQQPMAQQHGTAPY
jgi:hypothetical protein